MYLLNEKYQQRHLLAVALLLLYAKIDCAVVQSASWCACADYLCRCLSLRCAPQRGPVCFPPLSSLTNSTIAGCLSFCHYVEYHTQPRDCFDCADFYSWYLLWLMQRGSCTCFFFFFCGCDENPFGHLLAWTTHTRADEIFVVTVYGGGYLSAMNW